MFIEHSVKLLRSLTFLTMHMMMLAWFCTD